VSFQWPEMLWLLGVLPLLAYAWTALQRRRAVRAAAFGRLFVDSGGAGAASSAAGVSGTAGTAGGARERWWSRLRGGPRLRQYLPPVLLGFALLAALLAAARPTAVITLPSRQQTLVLAVDVSLSMRAQDINPTRMSAAQSAVKAFVQDLPADVRVALVSFAGNAALAQPPTRNREELVAAVDRFELQRGTATGSAILLSLATLFPDQGLDLETVLFGAKGGTSPTPRAGGDKGAKAAPRAVEPVPPGSYRSGAIVLLSDGRRTTGPDPVEMARLAAERGVKVYTVGFGTAQGAEVDLGGYSMFMRFDEEALKAVAEITRAEYFHAGSEADLRKVYEGLTSKLVLERAETEVTALFCAAAALLALLSAGLSVAWFGRIA